VATDTERTRVDPSSRTEPAQPAAAAPKLRRSARGTDNPQRRRNPAPARWFSPPVREVCGYRTAARMNGPARRNRLRHGLYSTEKAVRVLGSRALPSRSPALGRALHECGVSLIADRGRRDVMAAQYGARKHGGRVDAYVFCLISDWRGVRRLLVVPSGPSHQVALGLRLDFVPAPPRG